MSFMKAGIVGALCLTTTAACNRAPQGAAAPVFPPAVVTIEPAKMMPLEDTTEYVATLKSLVSTPIQPQIDGQITEIFVKSGDRIREGARILQIDQSRQQAAVSSQEAERAAREADVAYARQQRDRASQLLGAGAISKQELEQAETAVQTAQGRLNSLQAQVNQQQVQLKYFTVVAPASGTIGDVPVRVGNMVSPQTVLTTVDQNEALEVYVQVPIERAGALKMGLPIRVLSGDGGETLATTSVSFIASRVDDTTQSILVKGRVGNPEGKLRASQFVRADIVWSTTQGLVVPVTAALRINGQYFAFVAENANGPDGKPGMVARQRPIKVGPISGNNYTVLDGLKEGDRIIVSGVQKLAEGAPIAPTA